VPDREPSRVALLHKLAKNFILETKKILQHKLVSACLFGSAARGNGEASSDIDILIVAEDLPEGLISRNLIIKAVQETVRSSPQARLLRKLGQSILVSPVMLTPEEASRHPPIMLDMVDDSVILYDRDGFLQRVLDDIRNRLKDLGARKVRTRKGYYWILKPNARLGEEVRI